MNFQRSEAQRQAYRIVPETCPEVDLALLIAGDAVKKQTGLLRDALVDALEENIELTNMVYELERDIQTKDSRIDDLEVDIRQLRREIEQLEADHHE